jgi:hypothetical protein
MQIERFRIARVVLANAVIAVATLSLLGCQQSQSPTATSAPPESKQTSTEIFVTFEGPWAIVADPKNAVNVIAIAPKTKNHTPLAVVPANIHLDAGIYDLAIPASGGVSTVTVDKGIFQAHVDAEAVQHALDDKGRYAVRLPKPAAYVVETRSASRVGNTYPPGASTEQGYASAVALRYNVAGTAGFQLAGTPEMGAAIKPLLLELNTRVVRFTIDPIQAPLSDEPCHNRAREAFHDLTRLIGLVLYVDFPDSPAECRKKDPQSARAEKAQSLLGLPTPSTDVSSVADPSAMKRINMRQASIQQASVSGDGFAVVNFALRKAIRGVGAAFYFFHSEGGACLAPIILGV